MNSDHFVHFLLFTRRDWFCSSIRHRFYHLACLRFSAELFLFVIFFTFSFVLVQLSFIYRLSLWSLRNHYLTLPLFNILVRRWISSFNQGWIVRHYLLTRLTHSIRLIIIISIWWLDESFQLTIHSRINDHFIDHIISRLYLMTFIDYVTNRVFSMWTKYLTYEEIENHLYKTLCSHSIKIIHHLTQAST